MITSEKAEVLAEEKDVLDDSETLAICPLQSASPSRKPIKITLRIKDQEVLMEVDTGAAVSVMSA